MKAKALEIFKNVLFGVGSGLVTMAGLFILINIAGFNPQMVGDIVATILTGAAFYFVGKTVRETLFKDK